MKKQLSEKTVYTPNERVKVTVENKPVEGNEFERKVNIVVKAGIGEKLLFKTDDQISDFLCNVDTSEPQTSLGLSDV